MAYGLKYFFRFQAANGDDMYIGLFQKNYTGASVQRSMGQAPVLRREKNGNIWGSSLELYPECRLDQEFSELYTSDPYEWKVEVHNESEQELVWSGYVSPELYSEPDVAPPYDVQIIATDGLGELKFHDFSIEELRLKESSSDDVVEFSWPSVLDYIFSKTGFDFSPESSPAMVLSTMNFSVPFYLSMDCSVFEEKTLYDTLQALLQMLHASVFRWLESWFILRETDFAVHTQLNQNYLSNVKFWTGSDASFTIPVRGFGSLNAGLFWPVGRLTTQVQPAKRRIIVSEECRYRDSIILNPEFERKLVEDIYENYWVLPNWTRNDYASMYVVNSDDWGVYLDTRGPGIVSQTGKIIPSGLVSKFTLKFKALAFSKWAQATSDNRCILLKLYTKNGSTYNYLKKDTDLLGKISYTWAETTSQAAIASLRFDLADASSGHAPSADWPIEEFSLDFYSLPAGVLTIEFRSYYNSWNVWVGSCFLFQASEAQLKSTKCIVEINNGAREPLDTIEVDALNGTEAQYTVREDIISDGQQMLTSWSSSKISSTRSIEFLALDNALSYALPRLRLSGTLFVPAAEAHYPVALRRTYDGIYYIVESFNWNLLESEMEVEMISAPAADISIEDMTVNIIEDK